MESQAHAQAVETRILWETEGVNHIPELSALLKNESAETRVLAASLLGSLRTPDVIPYLEEQLRVEQSDLVRCALLAGLADCGQTPGKHGQTLFQIYSSVWDRTGPETDVDPWRLALIIGSIQGPEIAETLDAVRAKTDGGLGPMVQNCIEIRALYQAKKG